MALLEDLTALAELASRPGLPWGRILAVPAVALLWGVGAWLAERRGTAPGTVARGHEV